MYTVRFNILTLATLDGTTVFDPDAPGVVITRDEELGIIDVEVPATLGFGIFDPGILVNREQDNFLLLALTMISQQSYGAGDVVNIISPDLPTGAGAKEEEIIDLATNDGLEPLVAQSIPVDHKLGFDTTSTAPDGPHFIQLTLVPVLEAEQFAMLAGAVST